MSAHIYSENTRQKRGRPLGTALTLDGGSLGQDGDGSLGDVLLLQQGAHLGAPRVRAHPEEMTHLIRPLGGRQDLPAEKREFGHKSIAFKHIFAWEKWRGASAEWAESEYPCEQQSSGISQHAVPQSPQHRLHFSLTRPRA